MIHHLQHEGFSCGAIDLTRIGSENVTPDQWYKGLTVELGRSFSLLRKVNLKTWWQEQGDISPVQRLSQFIEEVLLVEVAQNDDTIIENWESQDEPEHLRTIRDRLLNSKQSVRLLELYRQILHQGEIVAVDSSEERELLLSGLVVKQQGTLRVQNRIYESIFV